MIYDKVISSEQLINKLNKNENLYIVDTREQINFLKPIESATHLPASQLFNKIDTLPKNKPVVLYCAHGVDSFFLMNILIADYGFSDIYSLKSGLEGWYKFIDR